MFGTRLRTLLGTLLVLFALGPVVAPAVSAKGEPSNPPAVDLVVTPAATPGWFEARVTNFPRHIALFTLAMTDPGPQQAVVGLADARTDGDGATEFTFRMPRHVPAGQWTLLVGAKHGAAAATATFDMPYLGPNGALAVAWADDGMYSFSSSSFQDNEDVCYWLTGPDGQVYAAGSIAALERTSGTSEKQGAEKSRRPGLVEISVVISPDMPRGQYAMSAYGMTSDTLAIASFTVN